MTSIKGINAPQAIAEPEATTALSLRKCRRLLTRPIDIGFARVTVLILLLYISAFKSLGATITGAVSRQVRRFTSRHA
jgi:hypothetical protein